MPQGTKKVDEETFWRIVEAARARGAGDPYAMAEVLEADFARADDETLRGFERQLIAASTGLYTWRHWEAAEMICGYASDDVFTDWRSWIITLGQETYARIRRDPDNLADVTDPSGGCDAGGEFFATAVSGIFYERHGAFDETFPDLLPITSPRGQERADVQAMRRDMPRLSARLQSDGLGRPPLPPK